ncbi:hypothetical protein [Catenulispora pinistramenti]|uniref:hypothetical protein n=1 Tax=Catenulispora pinistramenti TaxID=2705254 RepID=UPI0027DAC872|nr:hypothetical protein [Catenulispora pinistramenti]
MGVHRRGAHRYSYLARARVGLVGVGEPQDIRTAELGEDHLLRADDPQAASDEVFRMIDAAWEAALSSSEDGEEGS